MYILTRFLALIFVGALAVLLGTIVIDGHCSPGKYEVMAGVQKIASCGGYATKPTLQLPATD